MELTVEIHDDHHAASGADKLLYEYRALTKMLDDIRQCLRDILVFVVTAERTTGTIPLAGQSCAQRRLALIAS